MNNIKGLLERQNNERKEMALEILNNTKESLVLLGHESLLNVTTVIEDNSSKYEAIIRNLETQIIEANNTIQDNTLEIESLQRTVVTLESDLEEAAVTQLNEESCDECEIYRKEIEELKAQLAMKDTLLSQLLTAKKETPIVKEEKVQPISSELKILKKTKSYVFGTYKGIAFQSSTNINGTVVFDITKFDMKDEIEKCLIDNKLINEVRAIKDPVRIENNIGMCHRIDTYKYIGFVTVNTITHCFSWDVTYTTPTTILLKDKLANVNAKQEICVDSTIIKAINTLVAKHKIDEEKYNRDLLETVSTTVVDIEAEAAAHKAQIEQIKMNARNNISTANTNSTANTQTTVATESNPNVITFAGLDFGF